MALYIINKGLLLAFMQYILFLCYKQAVSIYRVKSSNVGKTDEAPMWCH